MNSTLILSITSLILLWLGVMNHILPTEAKGGRSGPAYFVTMFPCVLWAVESSSFSTRAVKAFRFVTASVMVGCGILGFYARQDGWLTFAMGAATTGFIFALIALVLAYRPSFREFISDAYQTDSKIRT